MSKVFISYALSDAPIARRLVTAFRNTDVSGWLDEADVASGDSIASVVRKALEEASAVVVLLSPRALDSQWVQFEIGAAEALGKRIIPVIIAGENLEQELPPILRERQCLDARGKQASEVVRELEGALSAQK